MMMMMLLLLLLAPNHHDSKFHLQVLLVSICQYVAIVIVIAIVGSRSGCTWREGRRGDKDVDRERVGIVDVYKGL